MSPSKRVTPLWLMCPYDVSALDDAVVAEALRSHAAVTEPNGATDSRFYAGARHAAGLFAGALPQPESPVSTITFNSRRNNALAGRILQFGRAAGLPAQRSAKLAAAVDEVALAGLGHEGGVRVRIWQQDGAVICEVGDRGTIDDPLVGRSADLRAAEQGARNPTGERAVRPGPGPIQCRPVPLYASTAGSDPPALAAVGSDPNVSRSPDPLRR